MRTFVQRTISREDWETPKDLFDKLDADFHFTLDVAASSHNAKCARYFTKGDDAMTQKWSGTCWLNPPYGRDIGAWIKLAYEQSLAGATVVCLVPSRTCAAWWHDYAMKGEVRFIRRRVKFVGAPYNAPFPSAVIIFRGSK